MRMKVSGFALNEAMVALLIVAAVGMQIVRSSATHAAVRAQSAATVCAARLALELSEWTQRQGWQLLGSPVGAWPAAPGLPATSCHEGNCDAVQGARHFLTQWHARLLRTIPGVRAEICVDHPPALAATGWDCDSDGQMLVLKLGWPSPAHAAGWRPMLAVALGPAD